MIALRLEAIAILLLVASVLAPSSDARSPVRSVLVPSSLLFLILYFVPTSFLLLLVRHLLLVAMHLFLLANKPTQPRCRFRGEREARAAWILAAAKAAGDPVVVGVALVARGRHRWETGLVGRGLELKGGNGQGAIPCLG